EVFMQLIRNPKGYKSAQGTLAAYLFGTARNLARRATRKSCLDIPLDDSEDKQPPPSLDLDALEKLSRWEGLALLHKTLLGLPELYREVVVLCDLEEMSYAQVAKILDCSPGTVASRLHRAHALLKTKLGSLAGNRPCLT
ncbi:MAG TPA: sigma-70 family RNA polymerase sigma factor, partial [Terriglobales bacterium]|nr:sigma-70 family RNA polymerase sigma factor [Terriglobales bacterium]